jgi:hypothetical protein
MLNLKGGNFPSFFTLDFNTIDKLTIIYIIEYVGEVEQNGFIEKSLFLFILTLLSIRPK